MVLLDAIFLNIKYKQMGKKKKSKKKKRKKFEMSNRQIIIMFYVIFVPLFLFLVINQYLNLM